MQVSPSRVSRIVDKLVNNGYLIRNTSTHDRRAISLILTDKGKLAKNKIEIKKNQCEKHITDCFSIDKLSELKENMEQLLKFV